MEETDPKHLGKLCQIVKASLFHCSTRSCYWLEHRKVSFLYTNWEMQLFVSINSYSMLVLIGKVSTLVTAINMLFMKEAVIRCRYQQDMPVWICWCATVTGLDEVRLPQPFITTPVLKHLCNWKRKHFRLIRLKLATYRCEALSNMEQWKGRHFQEQAVCQHKGL